MQQQPQQQQQQQQNLTQANQIRLHERLAAVQAYFSTAQLQGRRLVGNIHQATERFKQLRPRSAIKKTSDFVKLWVNNLTQFYTLLSQPKPGRPRKIADKNVLRECSMAVAAGYTITYKGRQVVRRHTSVETACSDDEYLKEVMETFHVSSRYIMDHMQEVDSGLTYKLMHFKSAHTPEQMAERKRIAAWRFHFFMADPSMQQYIIWLDSKSFYVSFDNVHVWIDIHDAQPTETEPRMKPNVLNRYHMEWYLAVAGFMGLVFFDFCTGTQGHFRHLEAGHNVPAGGYKVSITQLSHFPILQLPQPLKIACLWNAMYFS
jgi:hypothetical protein